MPLPDDLALALSKAESYLEQGQAALALADARLTAAQAQREQLAGRVVALQQAVDAMTTLAGLL